ncbi:MAG: hypothetical protein AAB885_02880 [Patescibacteria group bacterium]
MKKKHEKSPCRKEKIWRFGNRRRQCSSCGKTWSVWKRKTGRRRVRITVKLARALVLGRLLPVRSKRSGWPQTRNQRVYRLSLSRKKCATFCLWPTIPPGVPLIMIADALVKYVGKEWHTWYIMLVRPVNEDTAYVIPSYHEKGTETLSGWQRALKAVDGEIANRLKALVCDGHRGLVFGARQRELILQRCHFHFIARIQSRRSKWKTGRHQNEGKRIYELARWILTEPDNFVLQPLINELEEYSWTTTSEDLQKCLAGFVNHYQDFRSYLKHPELRLPATSNSAEAIIGLIENVCRRARGFTSVKTTNEWIVSVLKIRKTIKCAPAK